MATEPARHPPSEWLQAYTMGGAAGLERFYVDESFGLSAGYRYSRDEIESCIQAAREQRRQLSSPLRQARRAGGVRREDVLRALGQEANVSLRSVLIFGAQDPWLECAVLAAGARLATTVEYVPITYDHPQLATATVDEFVKGSQPGGRFAQFDVAIALSCFDHDGLGRYGDRLHPDGDLLGMHTAWGALRKGGRLLLSAPVGPDLVVWNLHRRYGPHRLPRLLEGWHEEARIGWDDDRLTTPADHRQRYEPLFVLAKNASAALPPLPPLPPLPSALPSESASSKHEL
jgi:SAM-dependent methyltransferase